MGQVSIILIAGLIFLFASEPNVNVSTTTSSWTLAVTFVVVLLPGFLAYLMGRLAFRQRSVGQRPISPFAFRQFAFGFELLALVLYVLDIHYFELPQRIHLWFHSWPLLYTRQLFGLIPLLLALLGIHIARYEAERSEQREPIPRGAYLNLRLKLLLLPVLPLLAYLVLLDGIQLLPLRAHLFFSRNAYLSLLLLLGVLGVAYLRSADILRWLWPTQVIPPCTLRTRLAALSDRTGIHVRDILIWRTGPGGIANAAVTGLIPRFRFIFLTDRLLEALTPEEIEGVVAHEMGHVAHRHLFVYFVYSVLYFFGYAAFYHYGMPLLMRWRLGEIGEALGTTVLFTVYFVLLFRYLSRKFEHQADLYAVKVTQDPEAFLRALTKLSALNHIPSRIRRWLEIFQTHPSIEQRCHFIERALNGDLRCLKYLRPLPITRFIFLIAPLLIILLFPSVKQLVASPAEPSAQAERRAPPEQTSAPAIEALERALVQDPRNAALRYQLAMLYAKYSDPQRAEEILRKILDEDPDNEAARRLFEQIRAERAQPNQEEWRE